MNVILCQGPNERESLVRTGAALISPCFLEAKTWKIAFTTLYRSDSENWIPANRKENHPLHFLPYLPSIVITFIPY